MELYPVLSLETGTQVAHMCRYRAGRSVSLKAVLQESSPRISDLTFFAPTTVRFTVVSIASIWAGVRSRKRLSKHVRA